LTFLALLLGQKKGVGVGGGRWVWFEWHHKVSGFRDTYS